MTNWVQCTCPVCGYEDQADPDQYDPSPYQRVPDEQSQRLADKLEGAVNGTNP